MNKWQCIFSTGKPYRAEIIKAVLEEKGISAVIVNKRDVNYHIGQIEVHVILDDVIRSIKIIEDEIKFS